MPKKTFLNLAEEKQQRFIEAALEEFAHKEFQSASITAIVKTLRIAKGSVYQYFEDKLDLWLYLKQHAEQVKMGYVLSVKRENYSGFWEYYRAMYENGVNFDLENPLCSLFLYRIGFKESSPQVQPYLHNWQLQANTMFAALIKSEQETGAFDKAVTPEIGAHFMTTMSMSIAELMQNRYKVNFDDNIKQGKPLFGKNKNELLKAVDELIMLLQKALT